MTSHVIDLVTGGKGGKGGGGGTPRVAQEAPNTLQSKSTLRVIEVLGEGEIFGPPVSLTKSIKLDKTPLQNADGSFNYTGISVDWRSGTSDQDVIHGFPNIEEETPVGVKVTVSAPVVRTITDSDTDAVRVSVRIPALTNQDTANGDLNGSSVEIKIEYQPNGGSYITAVSGSGGTITGKTVSPYERQYLVNLTGNAPWNIKVTRITADNVAANIQNDVYFSSYTRVVNHKLIYPNTALASISVDSALFGSTIPTRSYLLKGLILKVPSNYNPTTRVYTGVWDGTFQHLWTDNPAWVLYDLITNNRYGLGEYIDETQADKFAFYTIAQYCDGLVDNGAGGTEPRFTFNGVIESQEDALKVLQTVASCFRGMLYWGADGTSGIVTPVHDAPKDPVKIFSKANVMGGLFTYSGSAMESRHGAAYVTWNNPEQGYEATVEVVEDPVLLELYNNRRIDVLAYGCTSRGQAHRFGKWILDSENHESETVTFSVGLANADIRPGDVVKVQDADYADIDFGGRLVSGTRSSLTLDRSVTLESGKTYTIDIIMPNGSLETATISDAPGTYTTITLGSQTDFLDQESGDQILTEDGGGIALEESGALSTVPDVNTMWVITSTAVAPRQFRVIGVREVRPVEFEVLALLYDPTKFARVEQDINLPTVPFSRIETGPLAAPTGLATREYMFRNGPLVQSAVSVSWTASSDSRVTRYGFEVKKPGNGSNYELYQLDSNVNADVKPTFDGSWGFRVRAFDAMGNFSQYATIEPVTLSINGRPPADVSNFNITTTGGMSILSWDAITDLNLSHYEIEFNPSSAIGVAAWNNSTLLVKKASSDTTQAQVPSRSGTYLIKAVNLPTADYPLGVYSANATLIITNIDSLIAFNFVHEMQEDPSFNGTKTNTEVSLAGNLELSQSTPGTFYPVGYYEFDGVYYDLGAVYTSRLSAVMVISGNNINNLIDDWTNIDEIISVDGASDSQWRAVLEVSVTKDDPAGTPTWEAYSAVTSGDYIFRAVKPRLVMYSLADGVTPSVENLKLSIDMPDFLQGEPDLATGTGGGGLTVTFPYAFKNTDPQIAIAAQNMATGDYYEILSKSASGFIIRFKDSSGTVISRTFDYHAKGVGFAT